MLHSQLAMQPILGLFWKSEINIVTWALVNHKINNRLDSAHLDSLPTSCSTAWAWAIMESRSWPLGMRSIISCLIFASRSALERSSERTLRRQRERNCFRLQLFVLLCFVLLTFGNSIALCAWAWPYPGSWPNGYSDSAWPPFHWCCCHAVH